MIQLDHVTKQFGSKLAVHDVTLSVKAGEFFCFLGPNGAGKTTTIKMITGLLKPTSGHIKVGGYDIQREPLQAKKLLGYIPDAPFLYEKLTGREFMRFVAGIYQLDEDYAKKRSEELLELFEVREVADQLIEDYSHGMRQKLSFASCFLHDPKIVIVDEPWVGLDPKNIRFVRNFLKEKTQEGMTVFMSTHTLPIIEDVADRIGIIHHGNLIHTGTLKDILALAENPGNLEDVFLELTKESL